MASGMERLHGDTLQAPNFSGAEGLLAIRYRCRGAENTLHARVTSTSITPEGELQELTDVARFVEPLAKQTTYLASYHGQYVYNIYVYIYGGKCIHVCMCICRYM